MGGELAGNIRNRDGTAPQVEGNLSVSRFRAACPHVGEGRLDVVCDPPLKVELESEIAADRDHKSG